MTIPQTTDDSEPRQQALGQTTGSKRVPMRQCVVTREALPQDALIRFGRSPDGMVVPDVSGKLPGRGVWITAQRESVQKGLDSNVFS
ncbi:MAG: DUF448 domain-containing protein, partial [Pseudomonadota bacterium]